MRWRVRKRRVDRLIRLIEMRATGSPADLADRLAVSEATLYRDLQWIREQGWRLRYNFGKKTYEFYGCSVRNGQEVGKKAMKAVMGAEWLPT